MSNKIGEIRNLLRQMGVIILAGVLARFSLLVGQIGAAAISRNHLTALSLMEYAGILFFSLGTGLGQPLLILVSRNRHRKARERYISGAFLAGLITMLPLVAILFFLRDHFLGWLQISNVEGARTASAVIILTSCLMGFNVLFLHALMAVEGNIFIMKWSFLGNLINVLGVVFSVALFHTPEKQFLGIVIATFADEAAVFGMCLNYFKRDIKLKLKTVFNLWRHNKGVILGEGINTIFVQSAPLIYSIAFLLGKQSEGVAAYNVGLRLTDLVEALEVAIVICGTSWLSSVWEKRQKAEWEDRTRTLFLLSISLSILPIVLFLLGLPFILGKVFGLTELGSATIVELLVFSMIPTMLSVHLVCQLQVFRKQTWIAAIRLITTYLVGIPFAFFFMSRNMPIKATVFGFLFPSLLLGIWYWIFRERIAAERRTSTRHQVPEHFLFQATVAAIDGSHVSPCTFTIKDISSSGCLLEGLNTPDFHSGQVFEGILCLQGEDRTHFIGKVHQIKMKRRGWRGGNLIYLGIHFESMTPEETRDIESIITSITSSNFRKVV